MKKPGKLYVEFDALLDSRLGTLAVHHPEIFRQVVESDDYYKRDEDDFSRWGGPNREQFRALFEKRDIEVAQASIMTAVPFVVKNLMGILERDFEETPYLKDVGMTVNTYPYDLEPDEQEELQKIMMVYGGLNIVPEIIHRPVADITPEVIAAGYTGVIMYEFRTWLAAHYTRLKPMVLHNVSFIAPALIHGIRATKEDLTEGNLRPESNVHELTAVALREFLYLEPLPAAFFSAYRPELIEQIFPKKA